jgi:hypothetical protein
MAGMDEGLKALTREMKKLRRRVRLACFLRRAFRGGLVASLLALFLVALSRVTPVPYAEISPVILVAAGFLLGGATALFRPFPLERLAVFADDRGRFRARIITALELGRKAPAHPFYGLCLREARAEVARTGIRRLVTFRIPRDAHFLAAALFCSLLLCWLPVLPLGGGRPGADRADVSRVSARRLEKYARKLQREATYVRDPEIERLAREIKKLARALERRELSRVEALARISRLSRRIEDRRRALQAKERVRKALAGEKAGAMEGLLQAARAGDSRAVEREAGKLAEKIRGGQLSAQAMKGLRSAMEKAGRTAKGNPGLRKGLGMALRNLKNPAASGKALADGFKGLAERLREGGQGIGEKQLRDAFKQIDRIRRGIQGEVARKAEGSPGKGTTAPCPRCGGHG